MTAVDGAGVIGHFTLRFPRKADKSDARLGFVIVDDKKRGKDYGKQMVRLAVQYAFDVLNVQKVSLGVFENNAPAIGCYEACGFRNVHLEQAEQYLCMGQIWKCSWRNRKVLKRGQRAFGRPPSFFLFEIEKKLELEEIDAKKANRNVFCGHNSTDS